MALLLHINSQTRGSAATQKSGAIFSLTNVTPWRCDRRRFTHLSAIPRPLECRTRSHVADHASFKGRRDRAGNGPLESRSVWGEGRDLGLRRAPMRTQSVAVARQIESLSGSLSRLTDRAQAPYRY
jgi:hypothetical protein